MNLTPKSPNQGSEQFVNLDLETLSILARFAIPSGRRATVAATLRAIHNDISTLDSVIEKEQLSDFEAER